MTAISKSRTEYRHEAKARKARLLKSRSNSSASSAKYRRNKKSIIARTVSDMLITPENLQPATPVRDASLGFSAIEKARLLEGSVQRSKALCSEAAADMRAGANDIASLVQAGMNDMKSLLETAMAAQDKREERISDWKASQDNKEQKFTEHITQTPVDRQPRAASMIATPLKLNFSLSETPAPTATVTPSSAFGFGTSAAHVAINAIDLDEDDDL